MRELMLWRHAKSSWPSRPIDDADRPLNARGRQAAEVMARWMVTRHLRPDVILCSPAKRTRQTADRLVAEVPDAPRPQLEPELYLATAPALLARLRRLPTNVHRPMLIGHNDGIWELARRLAEVGPADQLAALREKYPTGALVWLRVPIERWADLGHGHGELLHFVRPRDLASEPG
jgi:phosphohistidine phosphatase